MTGDSQSLRQWGRVAAALLASSLPLLASADGIIVNRVYDPYVQPLETEVEWRTIAQFDDETPDLLKHYLGIGRSLNDRLAAEIYAIGTKTRGEKLEIDVYELELKWQLTEQGEYAFDWGAVFELERDVSEDVWEVSANLLSARDFGRWTAVGNFGLTYEWGSGVSDEIETNLRLQTRYRYREVFEPAIELHIGQDTAVLGPAMTGTYRFSPGRKLRWEAGMFFGLDDDSPDRVARLNLEYEF
ncbi:MAG: hypothetical protein P8X81_11940 [Woeseiaceae bacterium]